MINSVILIVLFGVESRVKVSCLEMNQGQPESYENLIDTEGRN